MQNRCHCRRQHRQDVLAFLQEHVPRRRWQLTLPTSGRGHETYLAHGDGETYFVKLGARAAPYQVMAELGLTPAVLITGALADDTSVMIQAYVGGRNPSWQDFRDYLESMAAVVDKTHHSLALQSVLPEVPSVQYKDAGLAAIRRVQEKWELYRSFVPAVADYVDETITQLKQNAQRFVGGGLVASHNDICNGNWLVATDGNIYLLDFDMMAWDDPAHDMGSLLWWYYPPELRHSFLERAGYRYDEAFKNRMCVRMAIHCLDIILPRERSFDEFEAESFAERLTDFRAVVEGRDNPRGFDD